MGLHERLLRLKKTRGRPPSINMCEYTMLRMILKCEMQSWHAVDYCTIKPLGGGGGRRFPKPKPMRNNLLRHVGCVSRTLLLGCSVQEHVVRGCVFWRRCARFHCWNSCACVCLKPKSLGPRTCARNVFARVRESCFLRRLRLLKAIRRNVIRNALGSKQIYKAG